MGIYGIIYAYRIGITSMEQGISMEKELLKGKENVYFMKLVDEYDMLAFAEDFPEGVTVETPDGEQVEPVTDAKGNVI